MKDSLIWVSENEGDADNELLLAGTHGKGGYTIAMLLDFCESTERGRRFDFERFRETWRAPPTREELEGKGEK